MVIINWLNKKISGNSKITLRGAYHITVFQKQADGSEIKIRDDIKKNLLVTVGKDTLLKYIGEVTGGAKIEKIGVGDSTQAAVVGDTALVGTSSIKTISSASRVYVRPTLFVSVEYGYSEANFTWNELGLYDANDVLIARQVDASPLVKDSSKRAIVEWQLTI